MTDLLHNQSEITETYWRMGNLTYQEWEEVGKTLLQIQGSINWWIGDWLNEGEQAFGETYAQAIDVTGWNLSRLQSAKWVSSRVPKENRFANLSWSHHHLASKYDPPEQYALLNSAVEEGLSTREFKTTLKEYDNEKLLLFGGDTFSSNGKPSFLKTPEMNVVEKKIPNRPKPDPSDTERVSPRQQCPHCGKHID